MIEGRREEHDHGLGDRNEIETDEILGCEETA